MKFLVTTGLALWGAMLVSSCSSGDGPPTTPSFNPFGNDPSGSVSEPTIGSNNPPPATGEGGSGAAGGYGGTTATGGAGGGGGSGGPQTIAQLCAAACAQIEANCPSYQSATCPNDCAASASAYPSCNQEYEAVVNCVATTTDFVCDGNYMPQTPDCVSVQDTFATCATGSTTAAVP